MKAVILAGGRGTRLDNFTENRNKSMIELFEKPLIEYNLDHAIEAGVNEIIIVVCYKKEEIIKYFEDEYKGIKITYVLGADNVEDLKIKGIVAGIEASKEAIGKSDFFLMLADEIIVDAKLKEMVRLFKKKDLFGVCGIVLEEDRYSISKTYTAMVNEKGRVFRLIEKPKVKLNNIKGTGHCILKNEILDYIERTPINANRGQKELVDLIQVAIDDGKKIYIHPLSNNYVNINTKEDYQMAKDAIKKSNPRVLIVHNQMNFYGGAELLIVEMCNWLTKMGVQNDILALSKSKEVERNLINTDIITPKNDIDLNPPGYKNIKDIFAAIKVFRQSLRKIEKNYDVINFNDFPVTWALWPKKKPSVWFMNLPPSLFSKPDAGIFYKTLHRMRVLVDRYIIRNTMDIITVAEEINLLRAKERYGMGAKLIDFGINYEFFSKGNALKAKKKFDLKKRFVVIQSGQLCEVKNQLDSLRTIAKIKDKIPNVLLILTGTPDPAYKQKIDAYIKEKKLEKYVLFIGMFKSKEELADLYKASDVGLYPIGKQGGVLAPLEAVCAKIPIIVSKEMETASLIKEKKLGIVTSDYASTLMEIYKNPKKYEEFAKKAAFYIRDNLSWKQFTLNALSAFKEAWAKNKKS